MIKLEDSCFSRENIISMLLGGINQELPKEAQIIFNEWVKSTQEESTMIKHNASFI